MTLDAHDSLDEMLREALRHDVAAAAGSLTGLEERVLESLGDRQPKRGMIGSLKAMIAPTRGGRWGQLAIVGATAAAFLFAGVILSDRLLPGRVEEPALLSSAPAATAKALAARPTGENGVLFLLPAVNAKVVSLVGSFSEWEPIPLSDDDGDGVWMAEIPLAPGRYEYAFIIDGRWWGQDPSADEYIRSFGEYSSVRYVGGGGDGA